MSTYDFSTLYTTLPHNLIKEKLLDLIERTFYKKEGKLYLSCNDKKALFTSADHYRGYHFWSCQNVCDALSFLLDKAFSKLYRRHYELISKFNVGLKSLLHQGLSEPEFHGDLVYKFKKIRGMTDFSDQFRKIIMRYKRIGYNLNVMRQSACLVFNPITVGGYAALFNFTPVDRASDSMMAPTF